MCKQSVFPPTFDGPPEARAGRENRIGSHLHRVTVEPVQAVVVLVVEDRPRDLFRDGLDGCPRGHWLKLQVAGLGDRCDLGVEVHCPMLQLACVEPQTVPPWRSTTKVRTDSVFVSCLTISMLLDINSPACHHRNARLTNDVTGSFCLPTKRRFILNWPLCPGDHLPADPTWSGIHPAGAAGTYKFGLARCSWFEPMLAGSLPCFDLW